MKTFKTVVRLLRLVKPLIIELMVAVITGVLGFVCVSLIAYFGATMFVNKKIDNTLILIIIALGVLKGIFKYLEQWFNHYIAFKVLAHIRDIIIKTLRRLAPAKLDNKDKGDLIANITSDVEILEAFYAHTISPIMIAFIYSTLVVIFISLCSLYIAGILLLSYFIIGIIFPVANYKLSEKLGSRIKEEEAVLKNITIENFDGLKDIKQFKIQNEKTIKMNYQSEKLESLRKKEKHHIGIMHGLIVVVELLTIFLIIMISIKTNIEYKIVIPIIALSLTSFKAVINVANVAGILVHSFASGKRILELVDEKPAIEDVVNENDVQFKKIEIKKLEFKYQEKNILKNLNLSIKDKDFIGICGESGSGKSTLLRLLMRFYDPSFGEILIDDLNLKNINTSSLRINQSLVTQETYLFKTTIKENIKIANLNATDEEIINACKKASIHDTIMKFNKGYETIITNNINISSGEAQRIGLARAFVSKSNLVLLDEPTANLDALNEGIILESIKENDRTIIMVSHRRKSLSICNKIIEIKGEEI
ncbi:amino acid ABC transporter ATP-binding/permease protein [Haploplasma axanthum]|nr:ABC transporter ATP-binding protein [Haploplasma axanthum]